ncbi:MAG: peptidylprolyl isomerase [Flavipsychrobacter sp.]
MAVIQKIRNKYGKIAGAVIAIALVGFILMDAASGRFGDLFGSDKSVAKVDGEKIDQKDFSLRVKEYETLYGIFSKNKTIDDNARAELSSQAMQNMVFEKVVEKQCDKLGIQTSPEEEKEIIYGAYPDPLVQQYPVFTNPETGRFDPQRVRAFEQQAGKDPKLASYMEEWGYLKSYVLRNNTITKFTDIINASAYTPKFVIDHSIKDQSTKASIRFVKVPFTAIKDDAVKVTDQDLNDYVQKHKSIFMVNDPIRAIDYVSFDIVPSHDDTTKVMDAMNAAKKELAAATDKDAEAVVNRNSDDRFNPTYVNKKTFTSQYADSIMQMPVGGIYGPYYENGAFRMAKVLDKKELPDSVQCEHILVRTKGQGKDIMPDSVAKQRIDSIAAAIKAGADFKTLAQKYSDDKGSDGKVNVEYTFDLQQRPGLSKEFGDFVFEGKTGESKVVSVSNDNYSGYHFIHIIDQKAVAPAVKLAIISKELAPSDVTQNAAYAKATEFAGKNATAAAFDEAVKKENLTEKKGEGVKPEDFTIPGLGPSREIIRWMYDAKVGDVSGVFSQEDRYVVAKLAGKQDKGLMQIDANIRPRLEAVVRQDKKAKMIADQYKSAGNLEAIASNTQQTVLQADSFTIGSAYVPVLGYEPKVEGYTFFDGLKPNTVSPGIKGSNAVYFISVTNRWSQALDQNTINMLNGQQRTMLARDQQNALNQMLRPTIVKEADVKYNPANIY